MKSIGLDVGNVSQDQQPDGLTLSFTHQAARLGRGAVFRSEAEKDKHPKVFIKLLKGPQAARAPLQMLSLASQMTGTPPGLALPPC